MAEEETGEVTTERTAEEETGEVKTEGTADEETGEVTTEETAEEETGEVTTEGTAEEETGEVTTERTAEEETGEVTTEGTAEEETGEVTTEGTAEERTGEVTTEGTEEKEMDTGVVIDKGDASDVEDDGVTVGKRLRIKYVENKPPPPVLLVKDGIVYKRKRLSSIEEEEEDQEDLDYDSSGIDWFPGSDEVSDTTTTDSESDVQVMEAMRQRRKEGPPSTQMETTADLERPRRVTRTSAPKRRQRTTGKKPQRPCPVDGCTARAINMARHFRDVHPELQQSDFKKTKGPARHNGGRKRCALCAVGTLRMDIHLTKKHKLVKGGPDYQRLMQQATVVAEGETDNLDQALDMYSEKIQDRSSGISRTELTASSHRTAVKTFLPSFTKEAILDLTKMGAKGGKIDGLFEAQKLKATSVKTYIHALAAFLGFVAGEAPLLRKVAMTTYEVETIRRKTLTIAQTLRQDINRQAVEEAGQNPDGSFELQPWMAGRYLEGAERLIARQMIAREVANKGSLSPREWCALRNSIILQLLLSNFKRSGDLAHLERAAVLEAKVDPDGPNEDGVELFVIQHKEAKSGKRCPLSVDADVFQDLQLFALHLAKVNDVKNAKKYLFTTKDGNVISPTNMSKIIESTWAAFGRTIGHDLPKLTGSGGRKLAVTTHREAGGDRDEQTALAHHMAHHVNTADKFYNKGQMKDARSKAVKRVKVAYKEAAKAHQEQEEAQQKPDETKGKKKKQSSRQ